MIAKHTKTLKIGSLFDGSGGFPLAGSLCGIKPVWASEVEPYPIAVTRGRFPKMKHLGDISKINGAEIEPVDIITFGSPCQDLSVAGKRAGLKHEANGDEETTRSGLFMEAVRIIKEMREATNGEYPKFALWENVPGAFSSNKGEDFRIVLEELIKIVEPRAVMPAVPQRGWPYADSYRGDGWSLAYRVFDAQYWGVPQRRRRIHLVADFRGERAQEVLFEREGLRGYFATGGAPGQGASADAERSLGADDRERASDVIPINTMLATRHKQLGRGTGFGVGEVGEPQFTISSAHEHAVAYACVGADDRERNCVINLNKGDVQSKAVLDPSGIAPSLYAGECRYGGGECYVLDKEAVGLDCYNQTLTGDKSKTLNSAASDADHVPCVVCGLDGYNATTTGDVSATLGVNCGMSTGRNGVVYSVDQGGGKSGANFYNNLAPTLTCTHGGEPVIAVATQQGGAEVSENGVCPTITAAAGVSGNNQPWICKPVHNLLLDDQGGQQISVRTDGKSPTLRAEMHGNVPCVVESGGFCPEQSAKTRGIGWEEEMAPTLRAGVVPGVVSAMTLEPGIAAREGGHIYDGVCGTLDRPAVCYTLSHGGFMVNPSCDGVADTLQATDYKDPQVIAIDRAAFNQGQNAQYDPQFYEDGTVSTLVARGPSAVCYWDGSQTCGTLTANNAGGNQRMPDKENFNCVLEKQEIRYIVRRLTPTECARLQGFADRWGDIEEKADFTDEEYAFWSEVRNTHAAINGKVVKEYTKAQMLTWYNKLHTDSAEYKLWGNGIALPPALYCMQGIVEACV